MTDPYDYPKLRTPIDARFESFGDKRVILLRCPLGIAPEPLVLISAVAPLLSAFQGVESVAAITKRCEAFGATEAIVRELVNLLDAHLFLESPHYQSARTRVFEAYHRLDVRSPALAGLAYAPTAELLMSEIDSYLREDAMPLASPVLPSVGLVAPHIDYRRGAKAYGHAYRAFPPSEHDLVVLIGTSHQYSERMFHLTRKHFSSPLGTIHTDRLFIDHVTRLHGNARSYEDEILHREEHSLELQIPFLLRRGVTANITPILVGSFHPLLAKGIRPGEFEEYESFASSLTEALLHYRQQGKRICIIAGVDMAHVGKVFGDTRIVSDEDLSHLRVRDEAYLERILRKDPQGLFDHIAEDNDARRVCGFPTLYLVLDVLGRLKIPYAPRLLDYRQAINKERDCCVTFASMIFERMDEGTA